MPSAERRNARVTAAWTTFHKGLPLDAPHSCGQLGCAMTYLRVGWKHQHPDEPVILYSELDAERWEVRKG